MAARPRRLYNVEDTSCKGAQLTLWCPDLNVYWRNLKGPFVRQFAILS